MTSPVGIFAIGSAHGADAIAWRVLERLRERGFETRFAPGQVALHACRFPAQMIPLMGACRLALIIDAVERHAGEIERYDSDALRLSRALNSTHGIGVGEALALAARLRGEPQMQVVFGLGVGDPPAWPDPGRMTMELEGLLQEEIEAFLRTADRARHHPGDI